MNIYVFLSLIIVLILCISMLLAMGKSSKNAVILTTAFIWFGFFFYLTAPLFNFSKINESFLGFHQDKISTIITTLVLFISGIVHKFSLRYMAGDRCFHSYFLKLGLLNISAIGLCSSNNMIGLCFFWIVNQFLLSSLMIHKKNWQAAKSSGNYFLKWGAFRVFSHDCSHRNFVQ